MERVVQKVKFPPIQPKLKRVAAYARVSSGKDAMIHSLAAQVEYYSNYIRRHPGWEYVGVYADEAKTGTKDSREQFQQLLTDCKAGKIDHIITKSISRMARNTGNLLLQTKYRENHLTKRTLVNHGQLPQYHATNTHEPIIDIGTYNSVQLEMYRRAQKYGKPQTSEKYPFSGMITCAGCGKHYRRKVTATGAVWICSTYNTHGKAACPSKAIPESTLMEIAAQVSSTSEITAVTAHNDNTLEFTLADGTVTVKRWQDRSRAESWTPEMRAAAAEKTRERKRRYA